jgi:hypothetical protein
MHPPVVDKPQIYPETCRITAGSGLLNRKSFGTILWNERSSVQDSPAKAASGETTGDGMAHFTSAFWRGPGACVIATTCAVTLSSPAAVAASNLIGMTLAPNGQPGEVPAAIDPITGTVTDLLPPGLSFLGNTFDVVSSGNTIYEVSDTFSTFLHAVNATTGAAQAIPLSSPITDMTVAITGASEVAEPTTAALLLPGLAGLMCIGRRRCRHGALHRPFTDLP